MTKDILLFLSENPFYGVYFSELESSLKIEMIPVPKYDHINILQDYLMQHTSPFNVKELRNIGLANIVDKINIWQSNMVKTGEWAHLDDRDTIEITDLQQRLLDLQFDFFVTQFSSKYIYSTRIERFAKSIMQNQAAKLDAFYAIKQALIKKTENNSYISIEEQNTAFQLVCNINFDGRIWVHLYENMRSNTITVHKVNSQYDLPPYSISVHWEEKPYALYSHFDENISSSHLTLPETIDAIFTRPVDIEEHKRTIQSTFLTIFRENIQSEEIIYDPVRECYCLSMEKEQQLFARLIPQESKCKVFAKYTSFSTLMATLQSRRIRINSIVAMNDKTEMFFLSDTIKNFQESIAEKGDNLYLANRNFITSFSERIDELDMWRFYGDNAHGVCMVFEPKEMSETGIKEVLYINKGKNEKIKQMNGILSKLKDHKINFRFSILDRYKPFYKSEDFKNEAEHRLLIVSGKNTNWIIAQPYNILSPYIERDLGLGSQNESTDFPLVLKKIILGPEMLNKDINRIQIKQFLSSQYFNSNIEVCKSIISTYR